MKDFILTLFYICLLTILAKAQGDVLFENINTKNGLSAAHTNQVIQDQKGFLWIATANGLNRYDGVDMKIFRSIENDVTSISGNNIRCLLEDSKGDIWVGTLNNGLNRYDLNTGKFTQYLYDKDNPESISSNEILTLFEDSQHRLWIGTEKGLNLFDYTTETFTSLLADETQENSLKANAVLSIQEDYRKWLWVGTWNGGLNLLIPTTNPKQFKFRHFLKGEKDNNLKSNHIWKLFLDKQKRLWIGTYNGGLSIMHPNTELNPQLFEPKFQTFLVQQPTKPLNNNLVFGLNQDEKNRIWVATVHGLTLLTPKAIQDNKDVVSIENIQHYQNDFFKPHSLIHNEMRDVFIDNTGIVWCSTLGGISKFDPYSTHFKHFLKMDTKRQNIPVVAILEYDKNTVYIGTNSKLGLVEYNPITHTYQAYFNPIDIQTGIESEFISFYKAGKNSIWIGTRTGLVHFNPKTKQFKNYLLKHPEGKELTNLHVRKIVSDGKNNLWLATGSGLVQFDTQKGSFHFIETDSHGKTLSNSDINDIVYNNNQLWLATFGGLNQIKFEQAGQMTFTNYLNDPKKANSICSNRIMSLAIWNDNLWIGTENGLAKKNEAANDFKNILERDGLKKTNITSMLIGNDNRLWLGTRQGLAAIHHTTLGIAYYNEKDGIQTGALSINASYKNSAGDLFFGGMNGYIQFKSEEIKSNDKLPSVYITDIKIFNQSPIWEKDPTLLKEITLYPDQNYFTVEFSALNFSQSSDNQYAYKLEGFNDNWVYCGKQKSVSFSNLDGGTYTFRVKASNNDGLWNEEGTSLMITVIPILWKRLWFQMLLGLIMVSGSFFVYSLRIKHIERQKIMLEQEVDLRTEEIRTQKQQIELLVEELTLQNDTLESLVQERTKTLKRSNLELKRSNQDLEQFAYIASHDLQEPLRTIGSFSQLFARRYKDKVDEKGKVYIEYMIDGVKRMSALIQSLLTYSRVGRSDMQFSKVDLKHLVKNKITDLSLKIQEKNAVVTTHNLPEEVICEKEQLGIVFYNLINNGLKFNKHPQPKITIQLEKETTTHWTFSIADNGIGIDSTYKERVFEIFKRLHQRDEFEGNGIGLALCKRIILRHEGDIWFDSVLNQGTTFYFTVDKRIKTKVVL